MNNIWNQLNVTRSIPKGLFPFCFLMMFFTVNHLKFVLTIVILIWHITLTHRHELSTNIPWTLFIFQYARKLDMPWEPDWIIYAPFRWVRVDDIELTSKPVQKVTICITLWRNSYRSQWHSTLSHMVLDRAYENNTAVCHLFKFPCEYEQHALRDRNEETQLDVEAFFCPQCWIRCEKGRERRKEFYMGQQFRVFHDWNSLLTPFFIFLCLWVDPFLILSFFLFPSLSVAFSCPHFRSHFCRSSIHIIFMFFFIVMLWIQWERIKNLVESEMLPRECFRVWHIDSIIFVVVINFIVVAVVPTTSRG